MTLEEAILHAEEVMVKNLEKTKDRNASDPIAINCFECADEHRQLAEWLKDYKRLLEQEPILDKIESKCDRINSLTSILLPYTIHREIQELLCEIMDLCKESEE